MTEADAATVLLVRAFEEADRQGALLSQVERAPAALAEGADEAARLVVRAQRLLATLEKRVSGLSALLQVRRFSLSSGWTWLICFLVGLGLTVLSPQREINVLNLLVVGLVGYNLAAYVILGVRFLRRGSRSRAWLSTLRMERTALLAKRLFRSNPHASVVVPAVTRFVSDWATVAAPLLRPRTARAMHLAALGLMAGTIAGLYGKGLVFGYTATWESTFLNAPAVSYLLQWLLLPGLWLLQVPLPELEPLRAPASGPAAIWIHLYAVSAAVWVLLPRSVLALLNHRQVRRLRERLPLSIEGPYFNRVLGRGDAAAIVWVVPYSFSPPQTARDKLHTLLSDVMGPLARIEHQPMVAYGEEAPPMEPNTTVIALFTLEQTPETEVHGHFLAQLRHDGAQVAVLVDSSAWSASPEQVAERERCWTVVLEAAGFSPVHINLSASADRRLQEAIWEQVA